MAEPTDIRELGLFPLGIVVLPGERVPLHIFEPRYRALVADCALEGRTLVISLATDDGVARVGCEVALDALVRRFADGRMNIVVSGVAPVELVEQTESRRYVTARARTLTDEAEPPDPDLLATALREYRAVTTAVAGAAAEPAPREGVPASYVIAGGMDLDAVTKQRLLESRSEAERLRMVVALLHAARSGIDRQEIAAERASTNGKVTLN